MFAIYVFYYLKIPLIKIFGILLQQLTEQYYPIINL